MHQCSSSPPTVNTWPTVASLRVKLFALGAGSSSPTASTSLAFTPWGTTQASSLWERHAAGRCRCTQLSRTLPMSSIPSLAERGAPTSPSFGGIVSGQCLFPSQPHHGRRMLRPLRPLRRCCHGPLYHSRTPVSLMSDRKLISRGNDRVLALGVLKLSTRQARRQANNHYGPVGRAAPS
jgi:hypothetical protein